MISVAGIISSSMDRTLSLTTQTPRKSLLISLSLFFPLICKMKGDNTTYNENEPKTLNVKIA